jgi:hypothetical protein
VPLARRALISRRSPTRLRARRYTLGYALLLSASTMRGHTFAAQVASGRARRCRRCAAASRWLADLTQGRPDPSAKLPRC